MPFTGIIFAIFVENLVIGIAVLSDKRAIPVFPRWYAYFSIVLAVLYCLAGFDVFSTHGLLGVYNNNGVTTRPVWEQHLGERSGSDTDH